MKTLIPMIIQRQPDETTCGPTCLHAVYQYFKDAYSLEQVISEIPMLESGGTLAVVLGIHALRSGYNAKLYTYNLNMFDPTWYQLSSDAIRDKLQQQVQAKDDMKLQIASQAYIEFIELGGKLQFEDLSPAIFKRYLSQSIPLLAGLSATYLYQSARLIPDTNQDDDIRGEPCGHFVVLNGYDSASNTVTVADPYVPNIVQGDHRYEVGLDRIINAILMGMLTYDGNLLIVQPR